MFAHICATTAIRRFPPRSTGRERSPRHAKASITPQAVVVDRAGAIRYRGRIDNFYAALGRVPAAGDGTGPAGCARCRPRRQAGCEAGDRRRRLLHCRSRRVEEVTMRISCLRRSCCRRARRRRDGSLAGSGGRARDASRRTRRRSRSAETIAPIVYANCVTCHRPGEAAPFSLITYEDVVKRGKLVARVTVEKYMPPWHAAPGHGEFVGERRLTEAQIAAIDAWVKSGMPRGNEAKMPKLPAFPADGWQARHSPTSSWRCRSRSTCPRAGRTCSATS